MNENVGVGAHLTAVVQRADVGRVLVRQLLAVGALEAQRVLVAAGGGVQPAGRVEAVVGEGLVGRGAQQLQEGQLDHVDRNVVRPGYFLMRFGGQTQRRYFFSV
ncbi:hypothetical protein EYF80_048151 [Liparis tanakae]|uniref:Uncharacterized protein n=1 Tax=Liparis tanakae TaxID=230148 RepID=A0A4Z2FKJ7_9TELE|nr:hypothetical protein EYF80_048151 [Liparis tanakae]